MKILYIITRSVFGGAQTHVLDLIKACKENNWDIGLVAFEPGYLLNIVKEMGIPVWIVRTDVNAVQIFTDIRAVFSLSEIIRKFNPDIVHTHSSKAGVLGRMAAWMRRKKSIYTAHGWAFTDGVEIKRKIFAILVEKIMAKIADRIICVSDYDRNLALQNNIITPERIIVIHNGIREITKSVMHGKNQIVQCVMVARFASPKDHIKLIESFKNVKNAELLLIGDGETIDEAKKFADQIGIIDKIKFLGNRNDVQEYLLNCDIFILISRWEGFPYSILEAMMAGLPVIASNVGGVSEAVVDGQTGVLVDWKNIDILPIKIQQMIDDPNARRSMGELGKSRSIKSFNVTQMTGEVLKIYQQLQHPRE